METEMKKELNLREEFPPHSLEVWKQAVIDSLKGADYDKTMHTKTPEGITLKPIYTKADLEQLPWAKSQPGQAPYLRGTEPDGYTQEAWIIAQTQDEPSLKRLNQIVLDELNRGLSCVQLQLHASTLEGRLPDKRDLACRGISLSHLQDIKTALADIDLKAVPIMILGNKSMLMVLALLNAWASETGIAIKDLHGAIACDPFLDSEPDFEILAQMCLWADANAPRLGTILLGGSIFELQGASAVQELAYTLASAHEIIDQLTKRGLSIDQIAPRFLLKLSLGSNIFMEIAKIRAARMLWSELIKSWGGSEASQKIWIHGSTAAFNKSSYDVWVNLLRTTTEGFAGVIGGVDSMQIEPFDSTLRPAMEFSRRIARNQQLVLAEEAHLTRIIDPAGGCWYIESLAAGLCEKVWARLQDLDSKGGMAKALENGEIAAELKTLAESRITAVNQRRDLKVGVNYYANPKDELLKPTDTDPVWLDEAMQRYADLKKNTSPMLDETLQKLAEKPTIELITTAWQQNADIEQIASAMKLNVKLRPISPVRALAMLEELRTAVESSPADTRIQLLNMGSISQYKVRNDFASGFFQTAGFRLIDQPGFESAEDAVKSAAEVSAPAVCICSTDDLYAQLVPELCASLRKLARPPVIILAGYPPEKVEEYKAAGIDIFIHLRANNYETNKELAIKMGVTL